ncbi:MAG TPA: class A beta-lactamase [Sphingomonadaceae bacterium]|nr:class A beta-lactamase [Sphingomonadaceae bacterium]
MIAALALGAGLIAPAQLSAQTHPAQSFETAFDLTLGTELREPKSYLPQFGSPLEQRVALLAANQQGRIGIAAMNLTTGETLSVLGDQRFPMASTSKIAIAATFLAGVDQGKWSLEDRFPVLEPVSSRKLSGTPSPLREGKEYSARYLIELMITRSHNAATDGLLKVVGGPDAVNAWVKNAGIKEFSLDRYIATLVRDDGEFDPAEHIDLRDSATPMAMVELLKGLHEGKWLSKDSRDVLLGAMERCVTGKSRIPGQMPADAIVAHKTGSLYNTSSDIGFVTSPEGHTIALAIYVTGGKMNKQYRYDRIATIARTIYDGYTGPGRVWLRAANSN